MRVLFLSAWYPYPPDNGSKLRVAYLLRALGCAHSVSLYSFTFGTAKPADVSVPLSHLDGVETVAIDPFVANRTGALQTFLSLSPLATRAVPAMQALVGRALDACKYDAVIASTEITAVYALLAQSNTIRILEEHNSLTRWMRERYRLGVGVIQRVRYWVSWQKSRHFEARLFRQFDLVTMVSQQDRAICHSDLPGYRGRVEVVPNGVDTIHNRPGVAPTLPNELVFNGSLTYSANYEAVAWFLTYVYPLIKSQEPRVQLTITGSTAGVDLARLPLDESVRLMGFVKDVRVPVAGAAVAVAPIRQGGGTRLKILEAMALGTPVVATTKGAEGLNVVDGQHLLLADTPEAFANAVLCLLNGADVHARLSQNARRLVEAQYDWAALGQQFVQLVEQTVDARPRLPGCGIRGWH